jgi:hypothetical protein
MKSDYPRDGKELQVKARTQGFPISLSTPMVMLYQCLAFPIKEKGKSFHRKFHLTCLLYVGMHRFAQIHLGGNRGFSSPSLKKG